ncbi:MAG: Mth938-like domain-containing protein [Pseudomonadota bacterium]
MRMREIDFAGAQPPIDGYRPGGFRLGQDWYEGVVLIAPGGVSALEDQGAAATQATALAASVDVLLIGQGADIAPLDPALRAALEAAGLAVEVMATPAACRTYNVLLAEDRRVAALLVPV